MYSTILFCTGVHENVGVGMCVICHISMQGVFECEVQICGKLECVGCVGCVGLVGLVGCVRLVCLSVMSVVSWHHGIMASWHRGITASWHRGIVASQHHAIMPSWQGDIHHTCGGICDNQ